MPFPGETFVNAFSAPLSAVGEELRAFYSQLTGWLQREHQSDGSHGDVTATSFRVSGAFNAVDGTFTGTLTQGGLNGRMSVILSSDDNFGPGITFTVPFGAQWRLSTIGGSLRTFLIRDLDNTGENGTLVIDGGTIGGVTTYTLRPYSAGINFLLGGNAAGQRIGEVNAVLTRTDLLSLRSRLVPTGLTGSVNDYAISTASRVFLSSDGAYDITGIVAGVDGQLLWLINSNAANTLTLKYNSGSSAAGNRILAASGADVVLAGTQGNALLLYDTALGFWYVIGA